MSRKKTADKPADADLLNAGAPAPEAGAPAPDAPPADPAAQPPQGQAPAGPDGPPEGAEAPEDKEKTDPAPEDQPAPATGVAQAFLLADCKLGVKGSVVRISRRKLDDLGLVDGEHWRPATAQEVAIGG